MKNQKLSLKAEKRKTFKRKVKTLRNEGVIPANLFGKKIKSQAIKLPLKDFQQAYDEAGETGLIELSVGSDVNHVLISDVQIHPVTDELLHVDFRQVDLKEKVTATVPVVIIGESPAEKSGLGNLVHQLSEVEVEALPTDLPEELQVDVSSLTEVDQAVTIADLKYDKDKVTIDAEPDQIVAKVEPLQEEEVAPPSSEVAETESENTPKPEETGSESAKQPQE